MNIIFYLISQFFKLLTFKNPDVVIIFSPLKLAIHSESDLNFSTAFLNFLSFNVGKESVFKVLPSRNTLSPGLLSES